ncbi:MAG: hypothetical protein H0V44_07195 [Planctomycetes bacterium]|nr:hypothetical protein [Planctomycetota bacterium]
MRYRDASHVDVGSFYARLPQNGKMFRLLGYAGVIGAVAFAHDPRRIALLLIVLIVAWLLAWYRVVGTLWRSSIVAAIIACAVILTASACRECMARTQAVQPASIAPGAP